MLSSSTNVMSSVRIENTTKTAAGKVRNPNNGKMNVNPVINPIEVANKGIGTYLSSYSNNDNRTILRGRMLVSP